MNLSSDYQCLMGFKQNKIPGQQNSVTAIFTTLKPAGSPCKKGVYGVVEQKSGLGDSGKKSTKHCSIRVIQILQCQISQLADDLCQADSFLGSV
jgi:hypothetical protein